MIEHNLNSLDDPSRQVGHAVAGHA